MEFIPDFGEGSKILLNSSCRLLGWINLSVVTLNNLTLKSWWQTRTQLEIDCNYSKNMIQIMSQIISFYTISFSSSDYQGFYFFLFLLLWKMNTADDGSQWWYYCINKVSCVIHLPNIKIIHVRPFSSNLWS